MRRSIRHIIVITCMILLAGISRAGVNFTPHPGFTTPPHYFSSTNARAMYDAEITFPDSHINWAQLSINGIVVWSETFPPPTGPKEPARVRVTPSVMFDSTYFADGSTATVQLLVSTNVTGLNLDTYQAPVFNKYRGYSMATYEEFPNGAIVGSTELGAVNYSTDDYYYTWTSADVLSNLVQSNVHYVSAHGNNGNENPYIPPSHQAETSGWCYSHGSIYENYEDYRIAQIGSGFPPYNSTGIPAINLFYLYSCNAGDVNDFVRACYPYMNAYGNWMENQAFFAYSAYMPVAHIALHADTVFTLLAENWSVEDCKENLIEDDDLFTLDENGFILHNPIRDEDITIWGDQNTRLKGVYTGQIGQSLAFSRVIGS